ncbi:DNA polymerase I [Govanella unica]|uniref:DNA polymerase I n=1 Tax=Govanella unica TaxID=2975056 RepID=A0A9X3TW87_9PROT|nr:DNA polymerase I [Govania unica]MDA5192699.1 DNA polymerase I [Govania unica]
MSAQDPRHLYLVDGSSFIFRAYHGLPPLTRPDGTPVNAVYGFATMLYKLLEDSKEADRPSHFAVILDKGSQTFRNGLYPDYKANRSAPPDDLIPQFPIVREAVQAFNLPMIELAGFEADDIIATYATEARKQGFDVTIVSSDKDLMQLIGPGVSMFDSMKNKRLGPTDVFEKFGVPPEKVVDVQALAGDSVDNIPGVPGIGVKTAAQLITEYGSLEELLARAGEIKQPKRRESLLANADLARISLQLVTLKTNMTDIPPLAELAVREIEAGPLLAFLDAQGFKALKAKFATHLGSGAHDHPSEENGAVPAEIRYETVTDLAILDDWIARAQSAGTLSLRTKTTTLNTMRSELVGISLAVEPGQACYIPVGHNNGSAGGGFDFDGASAPVQLSRDTVLDRLRPLLTDPGVLKVGQNIKDDLLILGQYDIEISPLDDSMLISYVLEAGLHGHGLDELAALHLSHKSITLKELQGSGQAQIAFDRVTIDKATQYACEAADMTLRLNRLLKPRLASEKLVTVYETLERPMPHVLTEMERAGIKVDAHVLNRLSNDFATRMAEYEIEIERLAGRPFNVNSPKQLGDILFDEMKLPGGKKGKTGAYTTSADVLEELADAGHDLPARILDYRQIAKLKSTYTDTLQAEINAKTDRIHTSYSLASTTTGRLSSNDPNLQNIPIRTEEGRKIRRAFVAEKGHKLIAADYSQIELRLLAHIAAIPQLQDAFAKGLDIHAMTASEVFGVPIEGMDPAVRRQAKAINFGIIYGISAFGLARQLGVPQREAQTYIANYFERFPGIRDYMDRTKAFARDHGFVTTLFGRRCHIQALREKVPAQRGFGERAAINAPIQGSAADIIRRAMIRMPAALDEAGLKARMLLQVHDELVFEVPENEIDASIPVIRQVMENAAKPVIDLSVPLVVDCGVGDNWDEAH